MSVLEQVEHIRFVLVFVHLLDCCRYHHLIKCFYKKRKCYCYTVRKLCFYSSLLYTNFVFKKHFKMIYTNIVQLLKRSTVRSRIKYIWFYVVRVEQWLNLLEHAYGKRKTIQDKKTKYSLSYVLVGCEFIHFKFYKKGRICCLNRYYLYFIQLTTTTSSHSTVCVFWC